MNAAAKAAEMRDGVVRSDLDCRRIDVSCIQSSSRSCRLRAGEAVRILHLEIAAPASVERPRYVHTYNM
jgi:hypothetical protein